LEKLASCATTLENRTVLDALADRERFRFDPPAGDQAMALLYRRFGDLERARSYAGSASDPAESVPAPLTDGVVTGRVLINGRPLAGLHVGLVLADQAQTLPGQPRPFEHRRVAAAAYADGEGRFRIDHVGDGAYLLIVMASDRELQLRRPATTVLHPPRTIRLDRRSPRRDLGEIDVRLNTPPAARPQGVAG
jgi:hypothetical protein